MLRTVNELLFIMKRDLKWFKTALDIAEGKQRWDKENFSMPPSVSRGSVSEYFSESQKCEWEGIVNELTYLIRTLEREALEELSETMRWKE